MQAAPGLAPTPVSSTSAIPRRRSSSKPASPRLRPSSRTWRPIPSWAAKLGDTEGRLGKLEGVRNEIAALNEAQGKIANDTKALSDKVAATDAGPKDARAHRQARGAPGRDGGRRPGPDGRLPQLAAISGKIADLEAALNTQVASLRKAIPADFDGRLQASAEAAEAARSGTQRVDRELAQVRTGSRPRHAAPGGLEGRYGSPRGFAAVGPGAGGQARKHHRRFEGSLEGQIKGTAKPADVSAAVAPVASKLAALEQNLAGVVKGDDDRKTNAERIVLSLELCEPEARARPRLGLCRRAGGGAQGLERQARSLAARALQGNRRADDSLLSRPSSSP